MIEATWRAPAPSASERAVAVRASIVVQGLLAGVAIANVAIVAWVCARHVGFPLNLDLMEGTVLQHVRRAAAGAAIYPEPTPDYVPLAYNPLYYVLAVPFSWVFGLGLSTLRLVAICGYVGSGIVIYRVVRRRTASAWWAVVALGLFAGAYAVMDVYLDTAHADSWFLCAALVGSELIDVGRSRGATLAGVVALCAAFWFKQHGALFLLGGLAFVTWRDGVRRTLPAWMLAFLLAPFLYVVAGPALFGPRFHYFTWTVPRGWSDVTLRTWRRFFGFPVRFYPVLSAVSVWAAGRGALAGRRGVTIWHVQLASALLAGLMASLDPGSSFNVYIPMGTFFILVGTLGLHALSTRRVFGGYGLHFAALFVTLGLFAYDPFVVAGSPRADASYADLVQLLRGLDGPVYAPSIGQLEKDVTLHPAAHWVALEDMIRGAGRDERDHPVTRRLLAPLVEPPGGRAYILANYRLDDESQFPPLLEFLERYYVLQRDFGDRFEPLRAVPKRFDHGWPRYLYRYAPVEAAARSARVE